MTQIDKTDAITRYLLGDASDEQRDWAEAQMLEDEDFLNQCLDIEDRLVDDYVLGHLSGRQKKLFEQKFLDSPRVQAKIKLVRALVEEARQKPFVELPQKVETSLRSQNAGLGFAWLWNRSWAPAAAFAFVFVVLLAGGFWTFHSHRVTAHLQDQLAATQHEEERLQKLLGQETQQQAEVAQQLDRERALSAQLQEELTKLNATSSTVTTLSLLPNGFRSGTAFTKHATITSNTKSLRLELFIEPGVNYPLYQIRLEQSNGNPVLTQSDLHLSTQKSAKGPFLTVALPVNGLSSGNYLVLLEAKDNLAGDYAPLGTYNFQLTTTNKDR